jgi:hypothetical protein
MQAHDFLETHDGCCINDAIQFKEQSINAALKVVVEAINEMAEKQDRSGDQVLEDVMANPRQHVAELLSTEAVSKQLPSSSEVRTTSLVHLCVYRPHRAELDACLLHVWLVFTCREPVSWTLDPKRRPMLLTSCTL